MGAPEAALIAYSAIGGIEAAPVVPRNGEP